MFVLFAYVFALIVIYHAPSSSLTPFAISIVIHGICCQSVHAADRSVQSPSGSLGGINLERVEDQDKRTEKKHGFPSGTWVPTLEGGPTLRYFAAATPST